MQLTATSEDYLNPIEVISMTQYFDKVPGADNFKEFKEKKIIVSEDHERLYSVLSHKSPVILHENAIEVVNDAVVSLYDKEPEIQVTSLHEGADIMAKFILPAPETVQYEEGDTSNIMLLLFNSYSKNFPFKLRAGLFRMVCANGMMLGDEVASLNARQMIGDGFTADSMTPNIERLISKTKKVTEFWEMWKDVQVPFEMASAIIEKHLSKKLFGELMQPDVYPMPMWEFYNNLTRISTHETSTYRSQVVTDITLSRLFYSSKSVLRELDGMEDAVLGMKAANNEERSALEEDPNEALAT